MKQKGSSNTTGDCSNTSYKTEHKSECCPGTNTRDLICWKEKSVWKESLWYIGSYKHIVVSTATSCSDESYNGDTYSVVYPVKFADGSWTFEANAPSCSSQGISSGDECDTSVATNKTCYVGLSNWINSLRSYYVKDNSSGSFRPRLVINTTGNGSNNVGCVWTDVTKWPQLLCERSGEYIPNGW
uniref:Uncharacterized protein n=1 Tax=uncultured Elusimicrobia bacterium TaxID=699876 RepID=A0A650EPS3_9BACT|nr:hypothetical protein Elusimicrob2101_1870 [uncultured Elusimicrobia bacterium]